LFNQFTAMSINGNNILGMAVNWLNKTLLPNKSNGLNKQNNSEQVMPCK